MLYKTCDIERFDVSDSVDFDIPAECMKYDRFWDWLILNSYTYRTYSASFYADNRIRIYL